MILDKVPSPGYISNGTILRREACSAISKAEIQLDLSPESDIGDDLRAFFLKCADLCPVKAKTKKVK